MDYTELYNLGLSNYKSNNFKEMKKYCLLAIDKGCSNSFLVLGTYYQNKKKYKKMKKYCLLSIDKGYSNSILILCLYYKKKKK